MSDHRTARTGAFRTSTSLLLVLAVLALAAAAAGPHLEVRRLVAEGRPRAVAECMVQLRSSQGQCEIGMFTGTYPPAFDSVPELVRVRDAVAGLRARGGRWSFADSVRGRPWRVCAELPGHPARCATDVRAALALAEGTGILSLAPRRLPTRHGPHGDGSPAAVR